MKLVRRLSALVLGASALLLSGARELPAPRGRGFEGERGEADPKALAALLERAASWPTLPKAAGRGPGNVQVNADFLVTPDGTGFQPETQAEPFVAANAEREGHLVAGYQEGRFFDGGARALGFAVSTDGGRRWRRGLLPGLTTLTGGTYPRASDPWVAFGPGGRVYYASLVVDGGVQGNALPRSGIVLSSSGDGGETWGDPVTVYEAGSGEFNDKEAVAADTRDDSPYKGRVYVGWVNQKTSSSNLVMAYSADGGRSFSRPAAIRTDGVNIGILPVVGPGGVVHAVWEHATRLGPNRFTDFQIVSSRSTDGGETWSEAVTVATLTGLDIPDLRTGLGLPSLAADPRNGNLYVAWAGDDFSPGVAQVLFSRSTDGGRTWSPRRLLSGGSKKAASFTPAVAVNGQGQVGVAFYSLRNDRSHRYLADEFIVFSKDEGRTFGPVRRVSAATFDTRFAAVTFNGFFLGDYQGLAAGRQTFYPVWVGTAQASRIDPPARQPDVFTRAIKP